MTFGDTIRGKISGMDAKTPIISAQEVDFYYGDFKALDQISMEVLPPKVTATIGHYGCGK